jgi:hypothetical protein
LIEKLPHFILKCGHATQYSDGSRAKEDWVKRAAALWILHPGLSRDSKGA